ncbi:VPS10 domain-containing receptor SorCS3 [Thelohanellus kitauei]|uniref:VPS10 domain-containing receptor SorCS3 n=1 Tax=Thelohanellus kitauei TaxID=669202 RepID=A0A0C2MC28_THEKT|nr:VPS10 domain-containing receptor SorCS3 [Thelohanellus kitauei]
MYDKSIRKCSFVVDPHFSGFIYVNLKDNDGMIRTYTSRNNGKYFMPIKIIGKGWGRVTNKCAVQLDLICSNDMKKNFPKKGVVKFKGTIHCKYFDIRHIFVSFTGGRTWKILNSQVDKIVTFNNIGAMFGTERTTGRIWVSYDEGNYWYKKYIRAYEFIDLETFDYPDNLIIAAISYNKFKNIYSLFLFNFSNILDRTCQDDDFESRYVGRYYGNCFQGQLISYLMKKPSAICVDKRTEVKVTMNTCPCAIEDFQW